MIAESSDVDLLVGVEVQVESWRMVDNLWRDHYLLAWLRHWDRARAGLLLT